MRDHGLTGFRRRLERCGVVGFLAVVSFLAWPQPVWANGGTIQISDRPAGPYRVTVMTSPSPLRTGNADVSVMVTDASTHAIVRDVAVAIVVNPDGQAGASGRYPATHANALNKLYYAANVPFSRGGRYRFTVQVAGPKGSGTVDFATDVDAGFFGLTPFELTCTAIPIVAFIAWYVFVSRTRPKAGPDHPGTVR